VSAPYLGPAEPRERLESLVPLAAELLRRDGRHFTMAQLRRLDGVWELVDVEREGGWQAVAGLVLPKRDGSPMSPSSLKSMWWSWVARQKVQPHLPMHGLRDSFGTWVYECYGVKQAQEWLGHGDPATTLRHYVRLTAAARAKAVAGLDEVTRAAIEAALAHRSEDGRPNNVVELASRRR
jgi:integrase